jgi:hypothetical protein
VRRSAAAEAAGSAAQGEEGEGGEARGREAPEAEAQPGQPERHLWYYVSDTHVRQAQVSEVLGCQAYILMYVRSGLPQQGQMGQQAARECT